MITCGRVITLICAIFTLSSLCAQPSRLPKQNIIFNKLPDELGLSQSSINSILQDRDGFLWIATWSGLVRYDGYTSTIYHSSNEEGAIKSNLISTLFEDKQGKIWVGTHMGGLFVYDKQTNSFRNFCHDPKNPNSLSNNNIWKIIEDGKNNLWIATENGLNFFDRTKEQFLRFKNIPGNGKSLSGNFVTDVFISEDKNLWIATNFGVNRLLNSRQNYFEFERYYDETGDAADNFAYAIQEVKVQGKNTIWYITKKGLKKIHQDKIQNFTYSDKTSNFSLFRSLLLVPGEKPYLLLGSAMGLSFFDVEQEVFTTFIGSLGNPGLIHSSESESVYVTSLYIDRGGVLWIGTKKGLYKSDSYKEDFKLYLTASFDKTNSIITGIQSAGRNQYWISTIGGGLFKLENETFSKYKIDIKTKDHFVDFIQSLYKDSKGNIWIGTAGAGIIRFHPSANNNKELITDFQHYHTTSSPAINDDYIVSFAEDRTGAIWAGTWSGGLIKIDSKGNLFQFTDEKFTTAPLVVMYSDDSGTLWIGTRGNGIYRVKLTSREPEVKHYYNDEKDKTSLSNDFINNIYEDDAGRLWFGTEGGLTFFDRRSEIFVYYPLKKGPDIKVIVGILGDDNGKLWVSHWGGITMVDPADSAQLHVRNFDQHDRIQGGFYYNNVCYKDADGNLLFGGSNGINVINPDHVVQNPIQPEIKITQFKLFNRPVNQNEVLNNRVLLSNPIHDTEIVDLYHNENTISFEFAALDFSAPEKIQYAYKLAGFDADWNTTNALRRYANYTNLNPGDYTFKIRASNSDGLWSNKVTTLQIHISPPWWKTSWALFAYGIMVVFTLKGLRKMILMRANLIHDIKVERLQRENLEKLNRAKLQFFTNISHEFRTPLTLILGPLQTLMDSNEGGKFVRDKLLIINNNAMRLLRLINQLLDFRKAETGNLQLQVSEGNVVKFAKEIKLSFDALAEKMKIDFSFHASSNVIKLWFDPNQFEKILFNLLANAFKNTPEGGKISVTIIERSNDVSISIQDSGKGIRSENFERIFQSFFSYDDDRHNYGTGIGLALVKSLVDAHHGNITVSSQEKLFTHFTITMPLGSDHLDASEKAELVNDIESINHYPLLSPDILFNSEAKPVLNNHDIVGLPKILIVEDNEEVRSYIKTIFAAHYIVLEAEQGKEGFNIALEECPDIIISDVMMPLMDGITLCRILKSNVATSHIPVVLLTARTSLIFKVEGLETGADDYVNKPFNPKILLLKVRNLLRSRQLMRKVFRDEEVLTIEPKQVTLNDTDEKFMHQILASVEKNMSNSGFSVEELLVDVGMSRTQLYRKLKAITGQSANEFIRTMRLKRAARLFEQNKMTVSEITYEVGFNDLQYFRECFKKYFGVTPSEYGQRMNFHRN